MSLKVFLVYLWLTALTVLPRAITPNACEYAGSNISYIRTNTERAINADKINMVHYYAYKALNAIDKSRDQFEACGCEYAQQGIEESGNYLKKAIKAGSILSSRMLLEKALEHALGSLEALEDHAEIHTSEYGNDLSMNTSESIVLNKFRPIEGKVLEARIDASLIDFDRSLEKVINTLPCKESRDYVQRVFDRCELELLKTNLTEGKRYYNLRTKEIAAKALNKLGDKCVPGN